jgi:hypothetical protein
VLAACAATDPAGHWPEDWAGAWGETGAGQTFPPHPPAAGARAEVDRKVPANLLRLNHARARGVTTPAAAASAKKTTAGVASKGKT